MEIDKDSLAKTLGVVLLALTGGVLLLPFYTVDEILGLKQSDNE